MIAPAVFLFALAAAPPVIADTPKGGGNGTIHGDWVLQCARAQDTPPCEIAQAAASRSTGEQIMRVAIAYRGSGDRYAVQIRLPLGISLSQKPLLRIDGDTDLDGYGYTRCDADGCYIERLLGVPEINRLRAAKTGMLAVISGDGSPMLLPLSFNGFQEALDASAIQNTAWAATAGR